MRMTLYFSKAVQGAIRAMSNALKKTQENLFATENSNKFTNQM